MIKKNTNYHNDDKQSDTYNNDCNIKRQITITIKKKNKLDRKRDLFFLFDPFFNICSLCLIIVN